MTSCVRKTAFISTYYTKINKYYIPEKKIFITFISLNYTPEYNFFLYFKYLASTYKSIIIILFHYTKTNTKKAHYIVQLQQIINTYSLYIKFYAGGLCLNADNISIGSGNRIKEFFSDDILARV